MKVQKVEGRAEYLRHVLSKTIAAEVLDKPDLTYGNVVNANGMLYEYWRLTRKTDVDRALGQPAGQAAALPRGKAGLPRITRNWSRT